MDLRMDGDIQGRPVTIAKSHESGRVNIVLVSEFEDLGIINISQLILNSALHSTIAV